ncbi:MAG TPA: hypothetical protein VHF69_10200 [Candidatus Synoicihabitans sp.]|nr:hypothetical protein [Candidatus Synoicihabitans sp.]
MPHLLIRCGCALSGLAPSVLAASDAATAAWQRWQMQSAAVSRVLPALVSAETESAVTEIPLTYLAFYAPSGAEGLEYSQTLQQHAGTQVRLTGHMVRDARVIPGMFLLGARPLRLEPGGSGEIADLPPVTVHVLLPDALVDRPVGFRPRSITVEGILELGVKVTPDGRNSVVRLQLDHATLPSEWVAR